MKKWRERLEKWGDECKLAFWGAGAVLRRWRYLAVFLVLFLVFGVILTFLNNGSTELKLMFAGTAFWEKIGVMGGVLGRMFGLKGMDLTGFLTLVIAVLQALAWSLLIFVAKVKKKNNQDKKRRMAEAEGAGIGASLALLGTGCSGCGVSLIAPIMGTIFSSGGHLAAAVTSWIFTLAALALSFFTVKRLGLDSYVAAASQRRRAKHERED